MATHVRFARRDQAVMAGSGVAAALGIGIAAPLGAQERSGEAPGDRAPVGGDASATFVLVHGGWHGGWCWRDVVRPLRAAGHAVWTPTLTGLGERSHQLTPDVDLDLHVQDVTSVLEYEDLRRVVLVGHSYAGMVISGVADRAPERISRLVFLDAFVPAGDQSLFDLLLPQRRAMYQEQARTHGEGWRVPAPPPEALGVTDAAQHAWLALRLTPHPLRTFEQTLRLSSAPAATLPRAYVHCTAGAVAPSFAPFAAHARVTPGWRFHELDTGHDAMVTVPDQVAGLLMSLLNS